MDALEDRRLLSAVSAGIAVDLNYGPYGKVVTSIGGDDFVADATVTADGRVVVVGGSDSYRLSVMRYTAGGAADSTFGVNGVVQYHYDDPATVYVTNSHAQAVYALPDGRILVAGSSDRSDISTLLLMRFKADGRLDGDFGIGGVTILANTRPATMTVQADGNILIDGTYGSSQASGNPIPKALWRFSANGALDGTFGTGGRLTYDTATGPLAVIRPLKSLAGGKTLALTTRGFARLNADGTADGAYGTGGFTPSTTFAFAVQADGGIVYARTGAGAISPATDLFVQRLDPDGHADATFGVGGKAVINLGRSDDPAAILVQGDGKILVGNTPLSDPTFYDFGLTRLLPDGKFDASFGVAGQFADPVVDHASTTYDEEMRRLLLLPDGRLLAVGTTNRAADGASSSDFRGNFTIAAYQLDPGIDLVTGGPYGPVDEGGVFDVSAAGTTYAGAPIVKYEWDYAYDGHAFAPEATGVGASLRAGDSPSAYVGLRVTTADGLQAIAVAPVAVRNLPPVLGVAQDVLGAVNVAVKLRLSVADAVSEDFTFTVNWGDGSAVQTITATAASATRTPTHTYKSRGLFTVGVTVNDGDGGAATGQATVRVGDVLASVFFDDDGDGTVDEGESPRAGHPVFLDLNQNGRADAGEPAGLTSDRGDVLFDGLAAGTYAVTAGPPAGYQFSSPPGGVTAVAVSAATGAAPLFGLTKRASVAGVLYEDTNGNGTRDAGEPAMGSQSVKLSNAAGTTVSSVGNNATTGFRFQGLAPGTYYLRVAPRSDHAQSTPGAGMALAVTVGELDALTGVDVGQVPVAPASVAGTVFNDANGDGTRGAAEAGAASRAVYLDANDNGLLDPAEARANGNSEGAFTLTDLPPGAYSIRLAPRGGWEQTAPAPAGAGRVVTLAAGSVVTGQTFGTRQVDFTPPHVTDFVVRVDAAGLTIVVTFDEDVAHFVSGTSYVVDPVHGGSTALVATYDAAARATTFRLADASGLENGDYRFELATTVSDAAGNLLGSYKKPFVLARGDVNGDRAIDFGDLVVIAQNYNGAMGKTLADGDLNGDGRVDFEDLVILAQNYNTSLPPAAASAIPVAAVNASPSPATAARGVIKPAPKSPPRAAAKPVLKPTPPTPHPVKAVPVPFAKRRIG